MTSSASRSRFHDFLLVALGAALLFAWGCDNRGGSTPARCTPSCSSVQICCSSSAGNRCIDHFSDPANCGACGNVCAAGQICVNRACTSTSTLPDAGPITAADAYYNPGSCSPACSADSMCCGSTCVSRTGGVSASDPSFANCGSCGRACDASVANHCGRPGGGATTVCMCGNYQACNAARGESCGLGPTGEYQCLRSDTPESCGPSHTACAAGESCEGGMCVCGSTGRPCPTGMICAGTTCRDVSSDPANCGAIGHACMAGEECVRGSCSCPGAGRACTPADSGGSGGLPIGGGTPSCSTDNISECGGGGGFPIPGIPGFGGSCGEVCCPGTGCVAVDNNNCGSCGMRCEGEETCGTGFEFPGLGDAGFPFP